MHKGNNEDHDEVKFSDKAGQVGCLKAHRRRNFPKVALQST